MGNEKEVKIVASVDQAAFATAKRMLDELQGSASRLVETFRRLNVAGGGGGGGGGATLSGVSSPSGAGSSVTQATHRMAAGGGGIGGGADGLSRAVVNSASLFKAAAEGSKGALKIMSDALRAHVSEGDREVKRLTASLLGLESAYSNLKKKQGAGGSTPLIDSALRTTQGTYYEKASQLEAVRAGQKKAHQATHDFDAESGDYEFSKPKGFWSKPLAQNPIAAGIAQATGIPPALLGVGGIAAAIVAGAAAGSALVSGVRTNTMSNIEVAIAKPFFAMNARAQAGQIYGGNALAIRHGDLARAVATMSLSKDAGMKEILGNDNLLRIRRDFEAPERISGILAKEGVISGSWNIIKSKAAQLVNGPGEGAMAGVGDIDKYALARGRLSQEQQALKAQQFQQALEAKMQEDPGFNDRLNTFYSGAIGNAGLMRAAGQGGGNVKFGGRNGVMVDQSSLLKAKATGRLYDVGEYASSFQQLASAAGRGFISHGPAMLSMKTGGLHNADALFGVGAQFGGGGVRAGDSFMAALQGKIGRGGLDVTAGSSLFATGAAMMTGGNFAGSSGKEFMGVLADAAATGTTGGDMLGSRMVSGGLGAMAQMMKGGIDPLQMALNSSAALRASPTGNYGVHKGLMDADPATIAQVLKTGEVPSWMAARGITADNVRRYAQAQNSTAMSRYATAMGAGSEMGGAAERYTKAGGLGYIRGMSNVGKRDEIYRLAEVIKDTTGVTREEARGRLLLQASMGGLLDPIKGRGAADPLRRNTPLTKVAGAAATEEFKVGTKLAADAALIGNAAEHMSTIENANEGARKMTQRGMQGDVRTAISTTSAALYALIDAIQGLAPKGAAGSKPGQVKPASAHVP